MDALKFWKSFIASLKQQSPRRRRRNQWRSDIEALEARQMLTSTLLGQQLFPADNPMNQNIANAPLAANSAAIIAHIGASIPIHPDWGADSTANGSSPLYGIPVNVVHGNSTAKINVVIDNYPGESDITPVPIPAHAVIEGDNQNGPISDLDGDSHLIVWDEDNNVAYELYGVTRPTDPTLFPNTNGDVLPHTDGKWHAAQETVWDMKTNTFRSLGATSADAAGLSILAGLVRPDEGLPVSQGGQGEIDHALRMTLPSGDIDSQYIYPASHMVSVSSGADKLPLGSRLRLANTTAINTLITNMPPQSQIIARAMQKYGLIVADIGSSMYVTGTSASVDANNNNHLTWNMDDDILASSGLTVLKAGDFQVVNLAPVVTGLSASTGSAGQAITITGRNFSGAAGNLSVFFNTTRATSVSVLSDTQISVVVPAGSGTVAITVQSGKNQTDNISDSPNANVNAPIFGYGISAKTAADQFTYQTAPPTTVPRITVTGGPFVYDGAQHPATVTVTGTVAGSPHPSGTTVVTYKVGSTTSSSAPIYAGVYTVNVTFTSTDPKYASTTGTGTLTIKPVVSTASVQFINSWQNISTGSVLLTTFSVTTGQALVAANFGGSINWNDGTALDTSTVRAVISGNLVKIYGTHTYLTSGPFHPRTILVFQNTVSAAATATPTVVVAADISSSVRMPHSTPIQVVNPSSPYNGLYQGSLSFTNLSATALQGALQIVMPNFSATAPGVTLNNAFLNVGGTLKPLSLTTDSLGDPVISIPASLVGSLAQNSSLSLTVYFKNPSAIKIVYQTKLYKTS